MRAIVFTPAALFKFSQYSITSEWFDSYDLPPDATSIKRVIIGDIIYLIDPTLISDEGPIVVIQLDGKYPVFSQGVSNSPVFERVVTVARSVFSTSVAIPTTWRPFHEGHRFSITASSVSATWRSRLHFDTYPNDQPDLVVFGRTPESIDFFRMPTPLQLHHEARSLFADAVLTAELKSYTRKGAGIILSHRLPQGFTQGATLEQWYKSKLTDEQREFVDKPYDGPVRLRGAAGTGKTLSLVVKFLRDAQISEREKRSCRIGFVTHSMASVDFVTSIAESLDNMGLLYGQGHYCSLEIRTLYDLAHARLKFTLDSLIPLSLDGREGRRLQRELIEAALREMSSSPILLLQFGEISPEIMHKWLHIAGRPNDNFVTEIMSEFANVLDGEGVRAGEDLGEKYATGHFHRSPWLMELSLEIDRRFILECHRIYRRLLAEMKTISVDQMVGDFDDFLDSNRWDHRREKDGYDALFVDELHLFTPIERQTLHKLIKKTTENDGRPKRPPIFMAYDLKQSSRGLLTNDHDGGATLFSPKTHLQNSDLVSLNKVFRYSPEIAEFLADLDASFPAINVPDEWEDYLGDSQVSHGAIPELAIFKDDLTLFKTTFNAAQQSARSIEGGGRRIAVLCPSEEIFDRYLKIASGQFEGKFVPVVSREISTELQHAGKRFIFSMPDYVAGLQFDTVYLMHVDAKEAPSDATLGARQRFIMNVYLGASRAEKTLFLSTSLTGGGPADILEMAIERKSLRQVVKN